MPKIFFSILFLGMIWAGFLGLDRPIIRSFFSSSFEPASYSLVGRLILNPNQPVILFNLLGLQRNLSKFEMNLPEIYLFSSPLLCLYVNFFLFCNCFHILLNILSVLN